MQIAQYFCSHENELIIGSQKYCVVCRDVVLNSKKTTARLKTKKKIYKV